MCADRVPSGQGTAEFVVRPDGTLVGDDGAAGAVAAALPYTGRLARRAGELLDVGDLRAMEASGLRRFVVGVTWTPAGEGTYRAVATPAGPREVPTYTVVGAADTSSALAHCVSRMTAIDGVRWSAVVTAASRVVAVSGHDGSDQLADVGNRMLAILRSLEDQSAAGFVRLRFEQGAVVGASLGRHALVAQTDVTDDDALLAMVDEVRAVLAGHDLSTASAPVVPDSGAAAPAQEEAAPVAPSPPPLVGARFAGAGEREPRAPRRRRFGRQSLSPTPSQTPRRSTRA
ncbi:hypothetical protein [Nocardioides sp. zg-1228]|uniref:hypothetical protein n=1 Tax=Nocardioides sp. zg-1228 TaxID=2763008 RepID=UPI00164262F6|nr:hypothetical protein [Nocardioides sp. zg-1228]MBC2934215.1 hypothetical protein [Nocardioides sp. zg-1228]QSF58959.1 hypothetical protein JX575_07225 [Nocardioides sp. zg-1228]